jgi:hypothetical protein
VIHDRVDTRYARAGATESCPGETDCDRWNSQQGDTPEEKTENACPGCIKFHTKPSPQREAVEAFLARIQTLALEAVVGYPPPLSDISTLDFSALLVWRQREEQIERSRRFAAFDESGDQ